MKKKHQPSVCFVQTKLIFFPDFSIIIGMGRKVKAFFHVFTSSIVPQTFFYARILKSKFSFSLLYSFVLLSVVTSIIFAVVFYQVGRKNVGSLKQCLSNSINEIPQNFILDVRDGLLSTNHELPLFVWFNCDERVQLLAVVDERGVSKNITSFGAQLLLTGSEIVFKYKTNTYVIPINKYIVNLHLDKQSIKMFVNKAFEVVAYYAPFFAIALILITPFAIYMVTITTILLSSFMVRVFYYLFRKHYSFKKTVQIGLHSCTFPLLTLVLFVMFPTHVLNTYILFFALVFIFQLVAVYEGHYIHASHRTHLASLRHKGS